MGTNALWSAILAMRCSVTVLQHTENKTKAQQCWEKQKRAPTNVVGKWQREGGMVQPQVMLAS